MEQDTFRRCNLRLLALLSCLLWCEACGGHSSTNVSSVGAVTALPLCTWPATFDPADATPGQCRAARVYLSCKGSNGGGEECLSDNLVECPGPNVTPGVSYSNCENQCQPGEYALACGDAGPGPWPQPPAVCRALPSGPGGGTFSCCPCEASKV